MNPETSPSLAPPPLPPAAPTPSSGKLAFALHAGGAAVTLGLSGLLLLRGLLSPVDLFSRPETPVAGTLRFAAMGVVFYGFSLALLRAVPLRASWGAAYALASWYLLLAAFLPAVQLPAPGGGGMMRRVADPTGYEAARQRARHAGQVLSVVLPVGFALVQAALLGHVWRWLARRDDGGNDDARR